MRIADCGLRIHCGMRTADSGVIAEGELRIRLWIDPVSANWQFTFRDRSALRNKSAFRNKSAIRNPHSAINPQSAIRNPQ
jgi:hypothetical protein